MCLASFTQHVFKSHPCYSMCWYFIPFPRWILFHCIHSPADGHLGYFHFGAIMKKAAMNIHVQVFMWTYAFSSLGCIRRSGIAGSCGNSMFNILKNHQNFFQSRCSILHSHQQHMSSNSSTSSPTALDIVCLFYFSYPSGCEVISYCGFDLHFPND